MSASELEAWFVREVLPLEAALMQFLRHNWRNRSRHRRSAAGCLCARLRSGAKENSAPAKPFVFAIARNLLINRVRREQIVPIEAVADLDALGIAVDEPGPDRSVIAREELRRLAGGARPIAAALPRSGRAAEDRRTVAPRDRARAWASPKTRFPNHLADGMRALADMLYGDAGGEQERRPIERRRRTRCTRDA